MIANCVFILLKNILKWSTCLFSTSTWFIKNNSHMFIFLVRKHNINNVAIKSVILPPLCDGICNMPPGRIAFQVCLYHELYDFYHYKISYQKNKTVLRICENYY